MSVTVVVGAGILGASVAHHLLERDAGEVIVVDSGTPAGATSGAGAGFVGLWAAGYANFFTSDDLELEKYGVAYYGRLSADIDYRANGNLYAATTEDGLRSWVEPLLDHPLAPEGTRALSPEDVTRLTGGAIEGVVGGALHPGGIQISAGRTTRALAARLPDVRPSTRVTGLLTSEDAVVGVRTSAGDIAADRVVLACGAWTNELLGEVGYRVPLLRMVATRVVSPESGVSPSMPTVMVPDLFGLWLREHRGGLTYGNGDGYAPLFELDASAGDGGQPRHEELLDRLTSRLGPKLRKLVPVNDTTISWWLQGLPCMTPDRRFLAGPVPDIPGLFVLGGDNEAGVTHGPGLGRLLADVIVDGSSDWVDPSPYRLDRFDPAAYPTDESVLAAMPARR